MPTSLSKDAPSARLANDSESEEEVDDRVQRQRQMVPRSSSACVHCKLSANLNAEKVSALGVEQAVISALLGLERNANQHRITHEDLQAKAHHQDLEIQRLLLQFDQLKADSKIRQSLTRAQYLSPPDINHELHTPQNLIWTRPFLFTVICAVASRYYEEKPNMYLMAMEFARDAAGRALIDGSKSVDVCQAYLLLAVYPVPKKKWAEDRSWLLMGVAIRMALELELNQPPPNTCSEREKLNRTRTWLNCYCVDGSHAIQFGKMPMLRLDDYLAMHSREWYKQPMTLPYDVHLCAYVHIIIIVAEFRAKMASEPDLEAFEIAALVLKTEARLAQELSGWVQIYAQEYAHLRQSAKKPGCGNLLIKFLTALPICAYRGNTTQMITSYLRLVVLAVGFQHAVKSGFTRDSELLVKSIKAAREVIQIMVDRLYPTGNLRFAMGANFLYVSFAAAFLINLLRPKLLHLLDEKTQAEIVHDVQNLISILGSKDVALDERHTPALYSRFLSSLLAKHNYVPPQVTCSPSMGDSMAVQFPMNTGNDSILPLTYSWPDIIHDADAQQGSSAMHGGLYQQAFDVDMDLSLSHFVRTVTQVEPMPPDQPPYIDIPSTTQVRWDIHDSPAAMQFANLWAT
ncbi:hypothetical protein H0H92_004973 [Tricholoma furcatifolium]|nr:hypothetical protein H0H92_004973 [Tricholoma furcatifolium]